MKKKKLGRKEGECEAGEGDGSSGKKNSEVKQEAKLESP